MIWDVAYISEVVLKISSIPASQNIFLTTKYIIPNNIDNQTETYVWLTFSFSDNRVNILTHNHNKIANINCNINIKICQFTAKKCYIFYIVFKVKINIKYKKRILSILLF